MLGFFSGGGAVFHALTHPFYQKPFLVNPSISPFYYSTNCLHGKRRFGAYQCCIARTELLSNTTMLFMKQKFSLYFFIVELTQGFYRNEHPDSDTLPVITIILFLQTVNKDSQNKLHIQVSG